MVRIQIAEMHDWVIRLPASSAGARSAVRSARAVTAPAYGIWQRGQRFVARPAILVRTIMVPHAWQGCPCRRNTSA